MFPTILVLVILTTVMDIVATFELRERYAGLYKSIGSPTPAFGGAAKLRFIVWVMRLGYWSGGNIKSRIVFVCYQISFLLMITAIALELIS